MQGSRILIDVRIGSWQATLTGDHPDGPAQVLRIGPPTGATFDMRLEGGEAQAFVSGFLDVLVALEDTLVGRGIREAKRMKGGD